MRSPFAAQAGLPVSSSSRRPGWTEADGGRVLRGARSFGARIRRLCLVVAALAVTGALSASSAFSAAFAPESDAPVAAEVSAEAQTPVAEQPTEASETAELGPAARANAKNKIRFVLQITIDQLRADVALRDRDRWLKGGFRKLYDNGVVFSDARHAHANTETIVGHVTLATGADPSVHGMVGNVWFDREGHSLRYNIHDSRYAAVGNDGSGAKADPAATRAAGGRSPEAMLAPTIADSIALAGQGNAKVFAVSLKDRGSVPMAGRAGRAYWWSFVTGKFLSSTYYYPSGRLPDWARQWNDQRRADGLRKRSWDLLLDPKTYRQAGQDDMSWEVPPAAMTPIFPHRFVRGASRSDFYTAVAASPFGDHLLLDFTRELIREEHIGEDDVVDYISVGFSSADYIGHRYGPSSLEMEDEVLRLDRVIYALLHAVDDEVGLDHTLVVLSSDHGVAEVPELLAAEGLDGGEISLSQIQGEEAVERLVARCGGRLLERLWPPYVYVDHEALARNGIDVATATGELAAEIAKADGVEAAFVREDIESGNLPDTDAARAVRRSFHAGRSGDIHVVAKPGWQIAYEGEMSAGYVTGHGTPWDYDTHVPLVIKGPGIPHEVVSRPVETVDVAPTIAALLGIDPPLRATGKVLPETLR